MTKRTGLNLKPKEFLHDARLKLCSWAARGVYVALYAFAQDNHTGGRMVLSGRNLTMPDLASQIGIDRDDLRMLLEELINQRMVEVSKDGCYVLPEMVKAEARSAKARAAGKMGGNPDLFARVDEQVKAEDNLDRKENVVSITSQKPARRGAKRNPPTPLKKNINNIYIYSEKVFSGESDPVWFEQGPILFRRAAYEALLRQLPVSDSELMDLLNAQAAYLAGRSEDERRHWLPITLAWLSKRTGRKGGNVVAA